VSDFIDLIERALNVEAKRIMAGDAEQKGDVLNTYADVNHSKRMLGYVPKIPLTKGLAKFVRWYKLWAGVGGG
jgi:UDP-glucuronate 4-epimerase